MAMTINGETVYVPSRKGELIRGLERLGVFKVAGIRLEYVTLKELRREYCRVRAASVRRAQRQRSKPDGNWQMSLFSGK